MGSFLILPRHKTAMEQTHLGPLTPTPPIQFKITQVRLPEDLEKDLDGLIIPGGESTAMAIVGERHGIFPKLKAFVQGGKPVWGTCAGMILLSNKAVMQKDGGQPLIGGLDVEVCRNYFGSQVINEREGGDGGE